MKPKYLLNKAKYHIEHYQAKEALFYISEFEKKYKIDDESILNYLKAKLYTLEDELDLAILNLKKIKNGMFYSQSNYLLSKIYFSQNNFDDGDHYFNFRLERGEKIDRKLYLENVLQCPIWNFEKNSRILIWQDFALGETILLLRLISLLDIDNNNISIILDPRLINFFKTNYPLINFIDYNNSITDQTFDFHLPVGSLIKILKFHSLESLKTIPNLNSKKNYEISDNKIAIFFSGAGNKDNNHKRIPDQIVLNLLNPLKNKFEFVLFNYGNSYIYFNNLLKNNGFKLKYHDLDIYNNFEDLSKIFLEAKAVITTSCSEAYIAAALGVKTLLLYNKNFTSHWMWENKDSNNKNYWFQSLYTFDFKWIGKDCYFKHYDKILSLIGN